MNKMFKDKLEKIKESLGNSIYNMFEWIFKNFPFIVIVLFGSSIMIIGIQGCEDEEKRLKKIENRIENLENKNDKIRRM
jgi:TATA-box binding protein (TBP) (component of TFIID and TFIIIB)